MLSNSSNSSTFDEGFYTVNSAINIVIVLTLLKMLVCGLYLLALVFAKEVNAKIKVLLINILATDVTYAIGITLSFLQYPTKARKASNDSDVPAAQFGSIEESSEEAV